MVHHQLDHHLQSAIVRRIQERAKVLNRSIARMNARVIGDVVPVIAQWRREKWQQPDARRAQIGNIIELPDQALKIADAVVVAIGKGLHVQLVKNRVLVPQRIGHASCPLRLCRPTRCHRSFQTHASPSQFENTLFKASASVGCASVAFCNAVYFNPPIIAI